MKKTIMSLLLLASSFATGQTTSPPHRIPLPDTIKVELSIGVGIRQLCRDDSPCGISHSPLKNRKVVLYPQFSSISCDAPPSESPDNTTAKTKSSDDCASQFTHYRGLWSDVVEISRFRAIGVVGVNKFVYYNEDGTQSSDYIIEGEIIGRDGLDANVSISTRDLDTMSDIRLSGAQMSDRFSDYESWLSIGPAWDFPGDPAPGEPVPCEDCDNEAPLPPEEGEGSTDGKLSMLGKKASNFFRINPDDTIDLKLGTLNEPIN